MNLILLEPSHRVSESRFVVHGARAQHIYHVLRAEPGQTLRVGLLDGPLGSGTVVRAGKDESILDCSFDPEPPPRPLVDLVLAIPRPKSLQKLLPEIAAVGVDRVVLLRTWRVGKPYLTAHVLTPDVYRPLLHEGLMQARCTREPRIVVEPLFKPFVEDRAGDLFAHHTIRLVAHPEAATPMASVRILPDDRVVVIVGPEGGLIPYELETLAGLGFQAVSMGPRPVRVETACVALLAQIALLRELSTR